MEFSLRLEKLQARIRRLHEQADIAALRCQELIALGLLTEAEAAWRKSIYYDRDAARACWRLEQARWSNQKFCSGDTGSPLTEGYENDDRTKSRKHSG